MKNTPLGVLCPVRRDMANNVRTAIKAHNAYVYIPDLRTYMTTENERLSNSIGSRDTCAESVKMVPISLTSLDSIIK